VVLMMRHTLRVLTTQVAELTERVLILETDSAQQLVQPEPKAPQATQIPPVSSAAPPEQRPRRSAFEAIWSALSALWSLAIYVVMCVGGLLLWWVGIKLCASICVSIWRAWK